MIRLRWSALELASGRALGDAADEPVVAASIIKLPVLLAVLRAVDAGVLRLDDELAIESRHRVGGTGWLAASERPSATVGVLARAMIDSSDNAATNVLVDHVGLSSVAGAIESAELRNTVMRRLMMDFEARAAGRENVVSAADACAAVLALVRGPTLSDASRRFAVDALLGQLTTGRLVDCAPRGMEFGHKTGELDGIRHDAGVLFRDAEPVAALAVLGMCEPGDEAELDARIVERGRAICAALEL